MNKKIFIPLVSTALIAGFIIIASCKKEEAAAAPVKDYSFEQEFDSMEAMINQGWTAKNNSRPFGTSTWTTGAYGWDAKKGNPTGYPGANTSHSGTDYAICAFSAQGDPANRNLTTGIIGRASCWLISPAVPMKNGDKITFYSRTLNNPADFADRMEFRINYNNAGVEIGNDSSTVGDFTTLAMSINPTVSKTGYPGEWTEYTYTVVGSNVPKMGRFGFRYNTPDAGNAGANGQGVGVDAVKFVSQRRN